MGKNNFAVVLVLMQALNAEEFIISYRAKIKNTLFEGEEYRVSKVIDSKGSRGVKNGEFEIIKKCTFVPLGVLEQRDVEKYLKQNKDQVLECLYSSGVGIYDEVITKDLQAKSKTIFKVPPKRVIAQLKDGVIEFSVLEKK
ncbi:hypothetical protein [Helicobacter kayseriensis]|uniref:hypothetical protein n=1 Tax=Helicobacter kayseriensis TaxID=2905877 RepID=UPI001E3E6E49|nr:hypothetical protein [Helicobacter kayseriensis]MCE3046986.1 hypothetical protein [Helicobacter kayseriensis]MCE3048354.1 hypothetical protein [Helicobacter kayseriensis]